MDTPLITWICIVAAVLILFIVRLAQVRMASHHHHALRHQFIEIGSEREEFFVPGDPLHPEREYDQD